MTRFGYTLMTEQSGPKELVRYSVSAEHAGFEFEVCSDHFSPWLAAQGHAPNAWAVLGAVAQVTDAVELLSYVTCPTMRYHPAVVAQQATTLQILADGRFTLGLGSGENSTNMSSVRDGPPSGAGRTCFVKRSRSSANCSPVSWSTGRARLPGRLGPTVGRPRRSGRHRRSGVRGSVDRDFRPAGGPHDRGGT